MDEEKQPTPILVIEDDYKSLKLFKDLLESAGYRVLVAEEGHEALRILETERPDLILMDIILPDINGFDLLKLVKEKPENKNIPVVAVTCLAMYDDRMQCLEAGFMEHIAKPISTTDFLKKIEGLLKYRKQMNGEQ